MTDYVSQAKVKMDKTIDALKKDFLQIRTGRANPAMVEDIKVEYYGALTPLNQMGSITTPEPRLIVITPYDKTVIKNIEKAKILASLIPVEFKVKNLLEKFTFTERWQYSPQQEELNWLREYENS
jgi:ribosome recycling factor